MMPIQRPRREILGLRVAFRQGLELCVRVYGLGFRVSACVAESCYIDSAPCPLQVHDFVCSELVQQVTVKDDGATQQDYMSS